MDFQGSGVNVRLGGYWTIEHILAIVIPVLTFLLLLSLAMLWFRHKKQRMQHEQRMLALERGLVPPDGSGLAGWGGRRSGWLVLAVGLPVFIAFAGGVGTFGLVDAMRRGGGNFTGIIITIWIVGGAVGLAAVIMGALGIMANQRQQFRRPPILEPARGEPPPRVPFEDRSPAGERIRKQEPL
jgi:hypothetical protein